ncbi:glycoside hydrolase family 9 protein [Paenibacillus sp. N4]|uniref:glycoside hydrolase family 9 protein n=1 Tax=Paenibacillus vietnamensis TaxID=2590547 RepID=UPI001CD0DA7F|nr:glycoside hydrolase family 9 protein [Paenibacillus vietnamensis]MCA0755046.1 glycoside hydrolase family 9 protein [Paenibacillus vietnamensis]
MKTRKKSRGFTKSIISLLVSISLLLTYAFPVAADDNDPFLPPGGADWNKLKELAINDFAWNYGSTVTDVTYQSKAARKITVDSSWGVNYILNGWQTLDISPYENGTLEFDAVGAVGGETFSVGFVDVVTERLVDGEFFMDNDEHPHQTSVTASIPVGEELTTEWKHYSVPLKDIFDSNSIFSSSSVQMLNFTGDENPKSFWISNIAIKSPDKAASYAPIKVNQVGYIVDGEKYALVSGYYDELAAIPGTPFQVKKASDMSVAHSGELSLVSAYDASSGEKVLKADFSGLNEPGEYVLTVDGVDEPSVAFRIGDGSIYSTLLKDVQKFFYFQRANEDLLAEHAGIFARTGDRKEDQNLPFSSNPSVTKDVSGGWWDAGDMGKYVTVGATAISDLLWAYESFPSQFLDHSMNIPESGNGIPDLLDEIKVETDFILKMQDEATGGFYAFVNREHLPDRYIMDGTADNRLIPTFHTGAAVGALAHAYIVMKDFPELMDYAETMKAAAIRGWEYLEEHPEFIPQPDGPYNSSSDENDRFYAAATLYRATGEQVYNDYVVANYLKFAPIFESETFSHNIGSLHRMGFYHYMTGEQPNAAVKTWFTDKFGQWRDIIINANRNKSVWGNSTLDGFYWGANSNNAGIPVGLAIGSRLLGLYNEDDRKVASGNLNYLLGINPLQMSYITGHGERRVTRTIHEVYNGDNLLDMPNGYMPGGPNNNGRYTFSGKAYNGSSIDWETNEQALNYNSPLTYLVALLSESDETPMQSYVNAMQPGWNLGNTLEAIGTDFESAWGNPRVTREFLQEIKAQGFKSIRIPVAWNQRMSAGPDYTIDPAFLDRVEEVVDMALDEGLYVMLNIHDVWQWMRPTMAAQHDAVMEQFEAAWTQIADRFKNHDTKLMFESANEPEYYDVDEETELEWLNEVNKAFFHIVRESGGNNGLRPLVLPTLYTNHGQVYVDSLAATIENLNDPNIITTVHYYGFWPFAVNIAGFTTFNAETKNDIDTMVNNVYNTFVSKGIPVVIGEYGILGHDKNRETVERGEMLKYFEYFLHATQAKGIATMWWDNGSYFNRTTNEWRDQELYNIIMHSLAGRTSTTSFDQIFIKSDEEVGDQSITLNLNGNSFVLLKNGDQTLVPGTDYTVDGNVLTLKASYLSGFATGEFGQKAVLSAHFSSGPAWNSYVIYYNTPTLSSVSGTITPQGFDIPAAFNGDRIATMEAKYAEGGNAGPHNWTSYKEIYDAYSPNYANGSIRLASKFFSETNDGVVNLTFHFWSGKVVTYSITKNGTSVTGTGTVTDPGPGPGPGAGSGDQQNDKPVVTDNAILVKARMDESKDAAVSTVDADSLNKAKEQAAASGTNGAKTVVIEISEVMQKAMRWSSQPARCRIQNRKSPTKL